MNEKSDPKWQPLSMISVFSKMTRDMLESSEEQLSNLEQTKTKPHLLDNAIIHSVLKLYGEQNEFIPIYIEQCHRWRKEELNTTQQNWVDEIESNIKALQIINLKILSMANHCEPSTIDKIIEKDDFELAVDFLSGKMKLSD